MTFEEYKYAVKEIWSKYGLIIPTDEEMKKHWEDDKLCIAKSELVSFIKHEYNGHFNGG